MTCKECRYWEFSKKITKEYNHEFGECRRYPKSFYRNDYKYTWNFPLMDFEDWCGEFQPRKENPDSLESWLKEEGIYDYCIKKYEKWKKNYPAGEK